VYCRCYLLVTSIKNLGNNELGPEGARHIADGLKENESVEQLYLGANKLGTEGVNYLSEALKTNSKLIKLDLGKCKVRGSNEWDNSGWSEGIGRDVKG
jgi:Ran GTPase-activating protein (RanGAP) involved in mRNA processing and transport